MNWLQATHFFRPRLLDSLHGYNRQRLSQDIGAGITVGVVALPQPSSSSSTALSNAMAWPT